MARRKEVFQSKVLQKLYPAPPTSEKQTSTPSIEALAKTTYVKRKTSSDNLISEDAGKRRSTVNPSRKMYTVLPPPPGHSIHLEACGSLPQLEVDGDIDPAEKHRHESSEESDGYTETNERKRRRRKKKRQAESPPGSGKDGAVATSESSTSQAPVEQRGECSSKNRKRKLKKKRHKEKLKSMGQMPRAAALEFTFQQVEEDNSRRTADLLDFLKKTAEICLSDPSQQRNQLLQLSASVDDLVDSIASGSKADSVMEQLFCLKTFAEQNKTENLENALKELRNNPVLTAEETAAVISLFQYWLTDILPMQAEETRPPT
ncbi:hypothetical protein FQA47_024943 [Oryzias melastigma]|uniref:Glutamate-rich 1 n=1 Tax=Oryzias melastigma TaxID=30732 RepID=A0A834F1Y0_ORYME|nr:hypothetical protein FQA47_024943 [Oryzias melastigma]